MRYVHGRSHSFTRQHRSASAPCIVARSVGRLAKHVGRGRNTQRGTRYQTPTRYYTSRLGPSRTQHATMPHAYAVRGPTAHESTNAKPSRTSKRMLILTEEGRATTICVSHSKNHVPSARETHRPRQQTLTIDGARWQRRRTGTTPKPSGRAQCA